MSIGTSMELKSKERQLLVISICILCAIVGFICTSQGLIRTNDHIDVALVIMPFVAIGGVYRLFKKKIRPFINGVFCSIALLLILVANFKFDASIALDQRRYIGFIPFYVLSFSGIYCCLYLVRILEKWRRGKKISLWVCEVGKYSMDIMTLHFVFFKLVDFFYSKVVTIDNSFVLSKYPRSLNSHWSVFIYVVVGIYGPICVRKFLNKLFHKLNTNFLLFS